MTKEEHRKRHCQLHDALDELAADFINQTDRLPSNTTVMELMEWSYKQTTNPTVKGANDGEHQTNSESN